MSRLLVLSTDLPYFPGKMGVDYFNLKYLSKSHDIGLLSPYYDFFPEQGVTNLKAFLYRSYFMKESVKQTPLLVSYGYQGGLKLWLRWLPRRLSWWILKRLLNIHKQPSDAFDKLCILSDCAPQLLEALSDGHWNAIVLIQSSIEPWLEYLPASGAKFVYFHDVRSDYLQRAISLPGEITKTKKEIQLIFQQEQRVTEKADVVGFVSELDLIRARQIYKMKASPGVAPIPVDTSYYTPKPKPQKSRSSHIILFTGHLSHPPNVDAVLFFLNEIWPNVLSNYPSAVFQVVGMQPADLVIEAVQSSPQCEIHANVPDIRPYFWNAQVYVVPMRYGGGVRQKIFEAWSMKIPLVCTTMAAEGSGAENAKHCWMEDSPTGFARRIVSILKSDDQPSILPSAKERVEKHNSISAAAPKFQRLVEKAIQIRKSKPFKLLYDLRWMELGIAGGIEQATYELLYAISQLDRKNEFRLFAPRSTCTEWNFSKEFKFQKHYSDPISLQVETARSFLCNKLADKLGRPQILTQQMRSLSAYHKLDFDIVHSVAGYTHPDMIGFPGILTINDLQHLHYPEFFTEAEYEERERLYRESAEKAKHIICISEYTRQDVHRQYGIPLEKMSTVWIIPSSNVWQPLSVKVRESLLAHMQINRPFFFFPAHCWPHKNHERLVKAFHRIISELPTEIILIMTGRPFAEDHPAEIYIRDNRLSSRIRHLGYRTPLEMRALFQGCLSLVFPSLMEGFGMPVAEAIIAGKPVLCSNTTALPELAGDAALTFNPQRTDEIAQRLLSIAIQPEIREELTNSAKKRRPIFSARRSAIKTLSIYKHVHDEFYKG